MARQNILISSLGDSPAVVTEAIDKLESEENIELAIVITVRTSDYESRLAEEDVLTDHLLSYYSGRILYVPLSISPEEIESQEDNLEFLSLVAQQLKALNDSADVYLSLAGGRKTMSAMMALAAQIYGAKMLFHVVYTEVDHNPELQWHMKPEQLRDLGNDSEKFISLLHPPLAKIQLVRFPFVSLFSLLDDLHRALSGKPGSVDGRARDLLEASRLMTRKGSEWTITSSGRQLFKVMEDMRNPSEISSRREQIVKNPSRGDEELSRFMNRHPQLKSKKDDVDTLRTILGEAEDELDLIPDDPLYRIEKKRAVRSLTKICSLVEQFLSTLDDEKRP